MKQSILVAALTAFLLSLSVQSANAQIFQPCAVQRPILFPRLRAAFRVYPGYSYGVDMTATGVSRCEGGRCSTCSGGTCVVDPVGRDEYVPTDEGNVPVEEYRGTKTSGWLAAVNRTRTTFGLSRLRGDATLDAGSESAANYCATVGGLVHTAGAEILAYNSSGIEVAIQTWLESPAHRAYLLSPNFSAAGVSVVRDRYGRVWCAVRFR